MKFRIGKRKLIIVLVIVLLLTAAAVYFWPAVRFFWSHQKLKINDQVFLYTGKGGNTTVIEGDSAILICDTKTAAGREIIKDIVAALPAGKKVFFLNTHFHRDHTGNNDLFSMENGFTGNYSADQWQAKAKGGMPANRVSDSTELNLGNLHVVLLNLGRAHTWSDVMAYVKESGVLVAGDVVAVRTHPVLDGSGGSLPDRWVNAIRNVKKRWPVNVLIPGHGMPGNGKSIDDMADYLEEMRSVAEGRLDFNRASLKYSDWIELPGMASCQKTADFIRNFLKDSSSVRTH